MSSQRIKEKFCLFDMFAPVKIYCQYLSSSSESCPRDDPEGAGLSFHGGAPDRCSQHFNAKILVCLSLESIARTKKKVGTKLEGDVNIGKAVPNYCLKLLPWFIHDTCPHLYTSGTLKIMPIRRHPIRLTSTFLNSLFFYIHLPFSEGTEQNYTCSAYGRCSISTHNFCAVILCLRLCLRRQP